MSTPLVAFCHIPKTAGLTFSNYLKKEYKDKYRGVYFGGNPFYSSSITKEEKKLIERLPNPEFINTLEDINLKVIFGHFGYNLWFAGRDTAFLKGKNFSRSIEYITFLRNPIEAVLSAFYFLKPLKIFQGTIEEFIEVSRNRQTLFISGGTGNLEIAQRNLFEKFKAFGITEEFDKSLLYMRKLFNWNEINFKNFNVNTNRNKLEEIPYSLIKKIEAKNEQDIVLYNQAKKKLDSIVI